MKCSQLCLCCQCFNIDCFSVYKLCKQKMFLLPCLRWLSLVLRGGNSLEMSPMYVDNAVWLMLFKWLLVVRDGNGFSCPTETAYANDDGFAYAYQDGVWQAARLVIVSRIITVLSYRRTVAGKIEHRLLQGLRKKGWMNTMSSIPYKYTWHRLRARI